MQYFLGVIAEKVGHEVSGEVSFVVGNCHQHDTLMVGDEIVAQGSRAHSLWMLAPSA
jgi:hypothetical protein